MNMELGTPIALLLAFIPLLLVVRYIRRKRSGRDASLLFSTRKAVDGLPAGWRVRMRHVPFALMIVALLLLTVAAARPRSGRTQEIVKTEGIDIMLVLDISGSMLAEDFEPNNRLFVAKQVISDFISKRKGDRIGLVLFAGKAFTQCPLTIDYQILKAFVERAEVGLIEDGTAIGMGLATATNRLRDSKAKSKVIILLTDGENNAGEIDPLTAARLAAAMGVKIYTIGAGTKGYAPVPVGNGVFGVVRRRMKVNIDEKTLSQVAKITGGEYFRATDTESLRTIYDRIDELEKTDVELEYFTEYTEYFPRVVIAGLVFLIVGVFLDATVLRRVA